MKETMIAFVHIPNCLCITLGTNLTIFEMEGQVLSLSQQSRLWSPSKCCWYLHIPTFFVQRMVQFLYRLRMKIWYEFHWEMDSDKMCFQINYNRYGFVRALALERLRCGILYPNFPANFGKILTERWKDLFVYRELTGDKQFSDSRMLRRRFHSRIS